MKGQAGHDDTYSSVWEVEAVGLVQGHVWLHPELEASLCYKISCLKTTTTKYFSEKAMFYFYFSVCVHMYTRTFGGQKRVPNALELEGGSCKLPIADVRTWTWVLGKISKHFSLLSRWCSLLVCVFTLYWPGAHQLGWAGQWAPGVFLSLPLGLQVNANMPSLFFFLKKCVWACVCVCVCMPCDCMWRPEDNFVELVFSYHRCIGSGCKEVPLPLTSLTGLFLAYSVCSRDATHIHAWVTSIWLTEASTTLAPNPIQLLSCFSATIPEPSGIG